MCIFAQKQDPLVEIYTAEDIETTLGLQRQHMIALALLVGCDYDRKGVVGIGCSNAMRLVRSFPNEEILERFVHCDLWYLFPQNFTSYYIRHETT